MSKIKQDLSRMHQLVESLEKFKSHTAQVGIFGNKDARSDKSGITNSELGFIHEMGSPTRGIKPRSFLRMPIMLLGKEIYAKAMKDMTRLVTTSSAYVEFLNNIGRSATDAIQQAFETSGFGSWAPNTPSTIRHKGSAMPLIDTGALRRSIFWRVR